jgi:hypothetical protein
MRGGHRAFFLEWQDRADGAALLPPIPAGLERLSPALETLITRFPADRDALALAAGLSQAISAKRLPVAGALEKLSIPEMRALLARVAEGGGPGVMAGLNRLTQAPAPDTPLIKCRDFAIKVLQALAARTSAAQDPVYCPTTGAQLSWR